MHIIGHFKTITHHKLLVMKYCFRVGLIRQGLLHDLSKYSWTEFSVGARYYTGTRSPNAVEREKLGYSTAWMHHKGRNKHHLEYWTDYCGEKMEMAGQPMPTRYMVESCLDRIAACKVYHGEAYKNSDPLDYLNFSDDAKMMHPKTKAQVVEILTMLAEKGEKETLRYIRNVVLKNPVTLYENLPAKPGDPAEKDQTFVSDSKLRELCEKIPTPFYLYSEAGIRNAFHMLRNAFGWNTGYQEFFPVKAAPTAGILKLLKECGSGVVCSSAAELELCSKCGFSGDQILFLPNYPTEEDLRKAAQVPCMPILDSPALLERFRRYNLISDSVGIRVNPAHCFRFGEQEVRTGDVKFGLSPDMLRALIPELKNSGVRRIGLHCYTSGNTLSADYYPALAAYLCDLAAELRRELPIAYINLSGGIGIGYKPGECTPDISAIGEAVQKVFTEKHMENIPLYTEIGRWLTGPYGLLVTRVNTIKIGDRKFAGVDASAADLMRPMMYGAYHHISVVGKRGMQDRSRWDVVGSVCENTDKFGDQRLLPALETGDILCIHDAGAHGHSMGYNYGGRLRSSEYLLGEDGAAKLIRRAETISDYLNTQIFE